MRKPFSLTPDPEFLYLSDKHGIALAMLEYGLYEQAGITVLTGDVGMGKTTLLRRLLSEVDDRRITVGMINTTHTAFGTLLEWVCLALGIEGSFDKPINMFRAIQSFVIEEYAQGRRVLLIIDEAQNLKADVLEQVRLLTNINSEEDLLLHVMLVGQPQLHQTLADPDLAQLTQRITSEYHLTPLDFEDTETYIAHRTKVAGQKAELFDRSVCAGVYHFSGGTPRLINKLCDYCLMVAFAKGDYAVSLDTLVEVVMAQKAGGANRLKHEPKGVEAVRRAIRDITGMEVKQIDEYIPLLTETLQGEV
ncbi:MAG: AAA family ATPase [Hahellaceae bacterium]|nr:AAA family ATPase [Hahellaceae bacterium]